MKTMMHMFMLSCITSVIAVAAGPKILTPGGKTGETYRAGWSYDISWDTTASPIGSRYKFQFGTSATGPWSDLAGATNVIHSTTGSFRRGQYRGHLRPARTSLLTLAPPQEGGA